MEGDSNGHEPMCHVTTSVPTRLAKFKVGNCSPILSEWVSMGASALCHEYLFFLLCDYQDCCKIIEMLNELMECGASAKLNLNSNLR